MTTPTFDATYASTDYTLRNRNYTILIRKNHDHEGSTRPPEYVIGSVNSEFQFNQNVQWEPLWGGPSDSLIHKTLASFGVRLIPQISTMQVWNGGGNELEFTVQFDLHAWSDPEKDVLSPLRSLMAMTMPSIDDKGFLRSPGAYVDPSFVKNILDSLGENPAKTLTKQTIEPKMRGRISISIGRWILFDNIAITGVQYQLHTDTPFRGITPSALEAFLGSARGKNEGAATGASVTVTFKPMFMMTQEDLKKIFIPSSTASGAAATETAQDLIKAAVDVNGTTSNFQFNDNQMTLVDLFDPLAT